MKVSVILTVLNEGGNLLILLDELLAQSRPPDEIVIVDGGSKDNTLELLNRYAQEHPVLKVYVEPGVNIAKGRNLAIARAQSDIIAVTDGGCSPDPDWLRELLRPFDDPAISAVAGHVVATGRNRFEYYCGLLSAVGTSGEPQANMFYGRSSAFRRELWEKVGGYPEWLYTAEDTLFALAAHNHGFKAAYASQSRLYWRPRPTLRKAAKMFYLYGRGNGRIQWGSLKGSFYWLRYHALWMICLLAGFFEPWLWAISVAVLAHTCRLCVLPNLRRFSGLEEKSPDRFLYVPAIALVRNLFSNLGYLVGHMEYQRVGVFRQRLLEYLGSG